MSRGNDRLDDDEMSFLSSQKAQPDCWFPPDPSDPDLSSMEVEEELLLLPLPGHACDALAAALRDKRSSEKARHAVRVAPNAWRGWVARLFHLRFVEGEGPRHQHRAALAETWNHDHAAVGLAAGGRAALRRMFVDAQFAIPKRFRDPVTLWRGLAMDDPGFRRGVSWTTDKRVAAWFAMAYSHYHGHERSRSPVVLRCEVPRAAVLHWDNERKECEAVCFEADGAAVDGDPPEWERLAAELAAERETRKEGFAEQRNGASR